MPKITIINLSHQEISVSEANLHQTVLTYIHESRIDWMHHCGKKGRCTTCKMIVVEGIENLSPLTSSEKKFQDENRLNSNERLACQALLSGSISIKVPKECQLPHLKYEE